MKKSTHTDKITMYQPLVKTAEGKYVAILSDNSVDRDGEIMGKEALIEVMENDGYTAILFDHENKAMNQIGEWVNKRIVEIEGHIALVAEPKFFKSNPNAQILKGMLDEGAKMGVSIGAIPKKYIEKKVDGIMRTIYTSLELLEASLVAIPSNRHGMVTAVSKMAKNYKEKNVGGQQKMEKEQIQKDFDVQTIVLEDLQKSFDASKNTNEELTKEFDVYKEEQTKAVEQLNKEVEDLKAEKVVEEEKVVEANEKVAEAEKKFKESEAKALHKGNFEFQDLATEEKEEVEKELEAGKVLIVNK